MINLLKDILNPNNWLKIFKKPKKFIEVFNDRVNYYPGLKFGYTKSKIVKKLYVYFNIFFAKKNRSIVRGAYGYNAKNKYNYNHSD